METMSKLAELTDARLHEDIDDDDRPVLRERELPLLLDNSENDRPDSQASMGIPTEKVPDSGSMRTLCRERPLL